MYLSRPIRKRIAWSWRWAFEGVWPREDPDGDAWLPGSEDAQRAGRPLTSEGHRFASWAFLGDRDFFFSKEMGLPARNTDRFCWVCPAN
eukprot:13731275-Alexandrium_andersonii.AAC.1